MTKHKISIILSLLSTSVAVATDNNPSTNPPPNPSVKPSSAAVTKVTALDYHSGSVVTVYQLVYQGERDGYQQGQPIGSFVNTANPWTLNAHLKQPNLAFFKGKPLGYEIDAYFVAKEAGDYSFAAEVAVPPSMIFSNPDTLRGGQKGWIACDYWLSVTDQKLFDTNIDTRARNTQDEDHFCGLTQYGFGTVKLEVGLHRVRQWLACVGERRLKNPGGRYIYPTGCSNAGASFTTDNFPGDETKLTLRVRHPQDNAPELLKTNEFVHEQR